MALICVKDTMALVECEAGADNGGCRKQTHQRHGHGRARADSVLVIRKVSQGQVGQSTTDVQDVACEVSL